ncbi:MAG: hypothetical protein OXL37_13465 [Chloroflexota bacterium]|nr:hypothetical protein [Chloroflexota bacterium]MDE2959266.1 hypothetical protein [Chloroflexota bacterium]
MSTPADANRDRLPFTEYAQAALEREAEQSGHPDAARLSFEELAASTMTFDEVAAQYGEETAVNIVIARDPDAPEWTPEDFAQARPTGEVVPHVLERWRRAKPSAPDEGKTPAEEAALKASGAAVTRSP